MSFNVAVVCEDHTNDQYILRPLISAVLNHLGKPDGRVRIVSSPRIRGFDNLLAHVCDVVKRYSPLVDIVLVCFDLDGHDGAHGHPDKRARVLNALRRCPSPSTVVVGAHQEVEVWALWGSRQQLSKPWRTVRKEVHVKENYFDPLLTPADRLRADGGRTRLMAATLAAGIGSLVQAHPELGELVEGIRRAIEPPGVVSR
jgi:hypothetical protein